MARVKMGGVGALRGLCAIVLAFLIMIAGFTISSAVSSLTLNLIITSSGTIEYVSPLHAEGRYIKNNLGQIIYLRGVNKHGFEDGPNGHWIDSNGKIRYNTWDETMVKDNLDAIKSWGLNVIRIFLTLEGWKKGQYQQNILDLITWAGERGVYIILGFGDVTYWYEGKPAEGDYPYPPYNEVPDLLTSKQDFINLVQDLANTLKGYPNVIFEVYGEWGKGNTDETARAEWFDVVQQCINAIRATGANQIIDVGWGWGIDAVRTMDWVEKYPLNDPLGNLLYDTHIYRDGGGTGGEYTYGGIKQFWQTRLLDYVIFNLSKPVLISEIGANVAYTGTLLEQELTAWKNQLQILNEWNVSYIAWWWWPMGVYRLHVKPDSPEYQAYLPNAAGTILKNATASS